MAAVARVARRLGALREAFVLVGGAAVPFLVPPAVIPTLRVTQDVDLVVAASTTPDYYALAEHLRALGFSECTDEGAPICRWVVEGIRVDVLPDGAEALGFTNRWYVHVLRDAVQVEVDGVPFHVASPVSFLATKFEAFENRGQGDYMGDPDFEDIITVMADRTDLAEQVTRAPEPVRSWLRDRCRALLVQPRLDDIVGDCLPPDPGSQARVPGVLALLGRVAAL